MARSSRGALSFALILFLSLLACGGDDQGVRFDEGRLPSSVPRDFPLPPASTIGETLVDTAHDRTEFSLAIESDLPSVVQFFTIELVNQGYLIDRSQSLSQTTWRLSFQRGDLTGEILVSSDGGGASQAVVSMGNA
ncbi:MAG TPA: hypothetical protein VK960_09960 [Acidimicrobiia bacterium]|nr:hypothetical protein [Acidimicrobiia bacterium]